MKHLSTRIMMVVLTLALTISMNAMPSLAAAVENQQNVSQINVNELLSTININELSAKFHVNSNDLQAAIENEANSPVFSPFSAVKTDYGVKASTSISPVSNSIMTPNVMSKCYQYNQNSTAYLATGYKTASGLWPAIGMCAVHHYSNGTPYIPFGTTLYYMNHPVTIQGSIYNSFTVEDTGDPNFVQSSFWTDLFFGANTQANKTAALNYGNELVNYYYYMTT